MSAIISKLTPRQEEDVQGQLLTLLARQAALYTMGESSSIPVETAQRLMDSITYTMELPLMEGLLAHQALLNGGLVGVFRQGQALLEAKVARGKALLKERQGSSLRLDDEMYEAALFEELPKFFRYYDWRYFAQEAPVLPDHLLHSPITERRGVSYVLEFLEEAL